MAYIRNDKWCRCEHSLKHLVGGKEEGVSVYEANCAGCCKWRPAGPAWDKRMTFMKSVPLSAGLAVLGHGFLRAGGCQIQG